MNNLPIYKELSEQIKADKLAVNLEIKTTPLFNSRGLGKSSIFIASCASTLDLPLELKQELMQLFYENN